MYYKLLRTVQYVVVFLREAAQGNELGSKQRK
jgi:hypothetical protein